MQGSLRIKLLGKHMMLNVTNVNGVATNAEVDRLSPPKTCKTIYVPRIRLKGLPRKSLQSWSMPRPIPYLTLLRTVHSATLKTTFEKTQQLEAKTCQHPRNL
jgi:hypothetical protein